VKRPVAIGTAPSLVLSLLLLMPTLQSSVSGQAARSSQGPGSGVMAITGGTVMTVTQGTIENGTVLIRDGKIVAVGRSVEVPPGASVVDASGKFVTPGIIDSHSHIGIDSVNEGGTTVSSMTNTDDVLNPTDINIYRDLAGGVTVANSLHGSANPVGGTNSIIKLRWGKARAEELLFSGAKPGLKFALGENPKDMRQGQTGPRRYPMTRAGTEFVLRDSFTRAREYQRDWQDYELRRKAGEDVVAPRRDLQLEPIVEVLEGKRLAHVHAYRADEMLMFMRLAEEFGFKVATFEHGLEGYKIAREVAEHGAAVLTFSDWWGYKIEAIDSIPHGAAIMVRNGVLVAIKSDSAEHARRLNTEAAKTIKWGGLTEDEALELVTINPAKALRIEDRVGSIEPGKDADLVVWTHHPLSTYAIVERTYVDGLLYYDREEDARRLTELQREKEALVAAEKGEKKRPTTTEAAEARPSTSASSAGNGHAAALTTGNGNGGSLQRAPARNDLLVVTNGRIHSVTGPTIERGTIVIRGGRIESVGGEVAAPAGAKVIDAGGADVYPGWIDAASNLGLSEPGPRGFADTDEMLDYNPQLRTIVSYHPDSEAIPVARTNGVTAAALMPGGGILGGQVPVVNLDGWTWEEAAVRNVVGITFQLPAPGRSGPPFGGSDEPRERTYEDLRKERERKLDELARLLEQARAYGKADKASRKTDWVLDALVPVAEGRMPLMARATREQDIRDAVAFSEKVGVKLVILGGIEAPLVAPLLAEKGIPVILSPVLTLPSREDMPHQASYAAAGALNRAGVKFAFGTGSNTNSRLLPYLAAISVAWGLPREEAIRALTVNAAEILGVADVLGSIAPGKVANLVIAKGDPLEIRTEVTHVIIDGRDVGLNDKHRALFERYSRRQ
jgi:imidazolonepropionase-like amidohydrolase